MIHNLDQGIAKFKALTFAHARPEDTTPHPHQRHGSFAPEEDFEAEGAIERRLLKSKDLREKLYREKREMGGKAPG